MTKSRKPLTSTQLENLNLMIAELEKPIELAELLNEVTEFFERHPTRECRDIAPVAMEMLLRKFQRIMTGAR